MAIFARMFLQAANSFLYPTEYQTHNRLGIFGGTQISTCFFIFFPKISNNFLYFKICRVFKTPYENFPIDLVHWGKNEKIIVRISDEKIKCFSEKNEDIELKNYFRKIIGKDEIKSSLKKEKRKKKINWSATFKNIFRK